MIRGPHSVSQNTKCRLRLYLLESFIYHSSTTKHLVKEYQKDIGEDPRQQSLLVRPKSYLLVPPYYYSKYSTVQPVTENTHTHKDFFFIPIVSSVEEEVQSEGAFRGSVHLTCVCATTIDYLPS